jgi:hypothetical protein
LCTNKNIAKRKKVDHISFQWHLLFSEYGRVVAFVWEIRWRKVRPGAGERERWNLPRMHDKHFMTGLKYEYSASVVCFEKLAPTSF